MLRQRPPIGMSTNMPTLWWQGRLHCMSHCEAWVMGPGSHCYTPDTGALLGALLCEGFCLVCTTPFTDVLGALIEYKKVNESRAWRSELQRKQAHSINHSRRKWVWEELKAPACSNQTSCTCVSAGAKTTLHTCLENRRMRLNLLDE